MFMTNRQLGNYGVYFFAAFFIGFGIYFGMTPLRLVLEGTKTTGSILRYDRRFETHNIDGRMTSDYYYYPTIEFRTGEGRVVTFRGLPYVGKPGYSVGATITVIYHPHEPQNAKISNVTNLWAFPMIMVGIGVLLLISLFVGRKIQDIYFAGP